MQEAGHECHWGMVVAVKWESPGNQKTWTLILSLRLSLCDLDQVT